MTVALQTCDGCGAQWFPDRLLCPRCGGRTFTRSEVRRARVHEVTTLVEGHRIAGLVTESGVPLVARLLGDAQEGDEVSLTTRPDVPGPAAYVPVPDRRGGDDR